MVQTRMIGDKQIEMATAWHGREISISIPNYKRRRATLSRSLGGDWAITFIRELRGKTASITIPVGDGTMRSIIGPIHKIQDMAITYVIRGDWPRGESFDEADGMRDREIRFTDVLKAQLRDLIGQRKVRRSRLDK